MKCCTLGKGHKDYITLNTVVAKPLLQIPLRLREEKESRPQLSCPALLHSLYLFQSPPPTSLCRLLFISTQHIKGQCLVLVAQVCHLQRVCKEGVLWGVSEGPTHPGPTCRPWTRTAPNWKTSSRVSTDGRENIGWVSIQTTVMMSSTSVLGKRLIGEKSVFHPTSSVYAFSSLFSYNSLVPLNIPLTAPPTHPSVVL